MHAELPSAARDLGGPIGETVNGRVSVRNLHLLCVDIVRKAADACGLASYCELQVALGQRLFRPLALSDVARDAEQSHRGAMGIAHNGAFDCDPARLAGM